MGYDIIGDVHGQADKLEALLRRLGYVERAGRAWQPPAGRLAVFVGDFIDRGPRQLDAVGIVRRMVADGAARAVMGNHELNATAWHTPDPDVPGEYLRPRFCPFHGEKNRRQHARFLEEVEHDPARHADIVNWFRTLPLWLELPGIRVVHACWHPELIAWLTPQLDDGNRLPAGVLSAAVKEPVAETASGSPTLFRAVETVTKGIEVSLPHGHAFRDKDGIERRSVRVRWWDAEADTYPRAALLPEAVRERLPAEPLPATARLSPIAGTPVFFGHYWMTGLPRVQGHRAACVDYSAGRGGPLVAYRWDGESVLRDRNFVATA